MCTGDSLCTCSAAVLPVAAPKMEDLPLRPLARSPFSLRALAAGAGFKCHALLCANFKRSLRGSGVRHQNSLVLSEADKGSNT